MTKQEKEDYRLNLSIIVGQQSIGEVLCAVHLPKRVTDPVELFFRPAKSAINLIDLFEFSIYGEVKDREGEVRTIISADKVYCYESSTKHWGPELSETVVVGKPINLTIIHNLGSAGEAEIAKNTFVGTFLLTPNEMLSPMYSRILSFTGDITVEKERNFKFLLTSGLEVCFTDHYRYLDGDNGATISFPELVAEFQTGMPLERMDSLVKELDDFLMLASFGARQYCACLGWELVQPTKSTKYFRRDVVIPTANVRQSMHDGLIDMVEYESFLKTAYQSFVAIQQKDLIRQAIRRAIRRQGGTLESNYLLLYSALETLVFFYRGNDGCDSLLGESDWRKFRKDLEGFIERHSLFVDNKERRKFVKEKLGELNRISFNAAFNKFCEHFDIELNDLWPVVEREGGLSLADIRNKLIHGDHFTPFQTKSLISAKQHLTWVVERSVLALLDWTFSKSRISPDCLRKLNSYQNWRRDRNMLSA
jgi:hypothetical protein